MKDIVGSVISAIMVFLMLAITPLYYVGIIEWARSETVALSDTRGLIDEVIDTRELREDTLADYNLNLASLSGYYVGTITRQVKTVNPDPANPTKTYKTYVTMDNNQTYNQGDIISVRVEPAGDNLFQTIAKSLLGMYIPQEGFTLAGRVR